jgi:hypothetical protein
LDIFRIFEGKTVKERVKEDEMGFEMGNNDVLHPQIYVIVRTRR